ncbi:MAG TPA: hypothetical protein VNX68_00445 [Nitrosopumilaceae archaeon]|jgi:hypothetical protein|nr:hypothetical protein [Nitrosopumilaceae archaeon]
MITKSVGIRTINGLFTITNYSEGENKETYIFRVDNTISPSSGTVNIWISKEHLLELSQAIRDHLEGR